MIKSFFYSIIILSGFLFAVNGQNTEISSNVPNRIQNNELGISFIKNGEVKQIDNSTYNIALTSTESNPTNNAIAEVSVSNRLYVDLPGSYGGRFYLDSPNASQFLKNRVMTDSIILNQQSYQRDYWVVYAGMGMWDCVINCFAKRDGQYYIVSLIQDMHIGKPGEIIEGQQLKSGDLKLQGLSYLKDEANNSISEYYKLLSSFQIQK